MNARRATRTITLSKASLTEIVEKRQTWFLLSEYDQHTPTASRSAAFLRHPLGLDELPSVPRALSLVGERIALVDPHPSTLRADVRVLGAVLLPDPTIDQHIVSVHLINGKQL